MLFRETSQQRDKRTLLEYRGTQSLYPNVRRITIWKAQVFSWVYRTRGYGYGYTVARTWRVRIKWCGYGSGRVAVTAYPHTPTRHP